MKPDAKALLAALNVEIIAVGLSKPQTDKLAEVMAEKVVSEIAQMRAKPLPKTPTYAAARVSLFAYLVSKGWTVKRDLKVPQAKLDGHTLYFHAQALYLDAHSTFLDIRRLSPAEFEKHIHNLIDLRSKGDLR